MTAQDSGVRAGRNVTGAPVVAVTAASSPVGRALCSHLVTLDGVKKVVAVDARRGDVPGATWRVIDLRDPVLVQRLRGVDVLVHLVADRRPESDPAERRAVNVGGADNALRSAVTAGVRRVVLVTSAMVYGANPDNPVPLDEDAPLRAVPDASLVGDLLEVEALAERAAREHPELDVRVVRPATLVGPGIDTVLTRYFEAPRLLVVTEGRPSWQFCHLDDLVTGLSAAALDDDLVGPLTVASEGWLEHEEVERVSGRRHLELPASLAFATAERLHRLGVTPAPASELAYTVHPWVVPSTRLRAAGWAPTHDNHDALRALLEETGGRTAIASRRLGRHDATATLGAAGATAAVLGAAALVRRSRRRRSG
jgi:nucleoside-diphosphate-sugar epimerase